MHFENSASRTKANVILSSRFTFATMHITDADVTFCGSSGMLKKLHS